MLKNYLLTAFRNFRRQRIFSLINVLGLSVGLSCSLLIMLWIQDEKSYEHFHEDKDQLYSVMRSSYYSKGEVYTWPAIPMPLAEELETTYPEITDAMLYSFMLPQIFTVDDKPVRENGRYVDHRWLEVFTYPVIAGDATNALNAPNQVAISKSLADKLFGKDWRENDVIGQSITLNNNLSLKLTAIFEDVPTNSVIDFDYLLPITDFYTFNDWVHDWNNNGLRLNVRLAKGTSYKQLNEKIEEVINDHAAGDNRIFLQSVTDRHLYNNYENGKISGGRITYVRIFTLVAIILLLIAAINFMNLATARSSKRMREIGVRKVVGARKKHLIVQFLGESVLLAIFAFFIAISLVQLFLPIFNEVTFKEIEISYFSSNYLPIFFGISILVGLIAGIYPAFFLASFQITHVLKGKMRHNYGVANIRKGLVVLQFFISIVLTIGTITVYQQVVFIQEKDIGIQKENLLIFDLEGQVKNNYESFRQELLRQPGFTDVTAMNQFLLNVGSSTSGVQWQGKDPETNILFQIITCKHDMVSTLGLKLAEGRTFSRDFGVDTSALLVNQAAVRAMGLESPIGEEVEHWGRKRKIVGVLEDFHVASLYATIDPVLISITEETPRFLLSRIEKEKTKEAITALEETYARMNPGYPLKHRFMDDLYEGAYQSESSLGKLSAYFALIAIFISCLGLFGLASYTADRRTKELGIRKVLGASASQLVVLLSREFTWLILIAFTLAIPVSIYFLNDWLEQFAYHTQLGVITFLWAALLAIGIAWLTVGIQALRAATANPVNSLRAD